jgi:hypothetical protein
MTSAVPLAKVQWTPSWRIIPSRFPPVDLFERIAPKEDWGALYDVETLTNDRVRLEEGKTALIRLEDRVSGPGTSLIMAPFSHPDPCGDHLSDGTFGIAYANETFETALARSIRNREEFLRSTKQGPIVLQMRVLNVDLDGMLHDFRGRAANDIRDPAAARELCRALRENGSYGIIFNDPLVTSGTTVAALRPTVLSNCRQERHLAYRWDGTRIAEYYDYADHNGKPAWREVPR